MLSIVVPTYLEAENIPPLITGVFDSLDETGISCEVIIVDDNSPDGIKNVVNQLVADYPVRLVQPKGRERDLSMSVIEGILAAHGDHILVMDADLSHPPGLIPAMYRTLLEDESAFVVGSRYVEHGSFDRRWSLWRFFNSHIATLITRPLVQCQDPMSGFFAFRRDRVEDYDCLNPIGYKIGLELMVRGNFTSVREVPINFSDRELGESKLNLNQQIKFLRHLRRLYTVRFGTLGEILNYGAVGAGGLVIDLLFYYFLQLLGMPHQLARACSFWPAVSSNWYLNRVATFGERKRRPHGKQWFEFVLTSLLGFSLNWGVYYILTSGTAYFDDYRLLALIVGVGAASVFNFVMSSLVVYNEKRQ